MIAHYKKYLLLSIVYFVIICAESQSDVVEGYRLALTANLTTECNETITSKIQCADCNTLLYCSSAFTIKCPSKVPFCNSGKCVDKPLTDCEVNAASVCPIDSNNQYYPDVNSCYNYYYCDETGKALAAYNCPVGFPFTMDSQGCQRGAVCGSYNCYNRYYAINSANPTLSVLCQDNKIVEGTYTACPVGLQLDESLSCTPVCVKTGNIPHETDTHLYYRCLPTGPWGALEKTLQTCPPKYVFDPPSAKCVQEPPSSS